MSQSEEVQTKVLNALYWDLAVPPHRVKVEVENGWVTISGTVDRYYQRTCAESDARRVAGVLGVNNHIRLASAQSGARGHRPLAIDAAPPAWLYFPEWRATFRGSLWWSIQFPPLYADNGRAGERLGNTG